MDNKRFYYTMRARERKHLFGPRADLHAHYCTPKSWSERLINSVESGLFEHMEIDRRAAVFLFGEDDVYAAERRATPAPAY